jgi:AcrR family transcriptional regulator
MKSKRTTPRPYRMEKRQARVQETRRRIIEVAREMFGEAGFHAVALEDVAGRAGVGRKTIYYQFGSKLGLFQALVDDLNERGGVREWVDAALAEPDIGRGVRMFVKGTSAFWEREYPVIRTLAALTASDEDARVVVDRVNRSRRRDLGVLAGRVQRSRALRAGWTADRVADSLWLLTSFETYDLLRRIDKSVTQATKVLTDLALSLIVDDVRSLPRA